MTRRLSGKTAVITGGARGQGAATARLFAAEGANVAITDVAAEEGMALALEIGSSASFHHLDVSSEEGWQQVVSELSRRWDGVDILINNAGIVRVGELMSLAKSEFEEVLAVNLLGPWLGMKAIVPGMVKRGAGSIVNICSISAMVGMNGIGAYASSKWALRGLSRTAALELGPKGVRVNSIFPGAINTSMHSGSQNAATGETHLYKDRPLGRAGTSDEVARTSLFLATEDASYLCGAEIAVDGGLSAGTFRSSLPGAPAW